VRLSAFRLPSKRGDQLTAQLARRRENADVRDEQGLARGCLKFESGTQFRVPGAMRHS
jgi:hypothetical protein